jgi:pimeloyl-ACP methyl ester carboxylesterase
MQGRQLVQLVGHRGRGRLLVRPGCLLVRLGWRLLPLPLSLLTVPRLGEAVLRSPTPRRAYRRLLGQGLSPAAAAAAPDDLVDVLRLAARRPGNARTVGSLMHAIDGFRRPRADSIMSASELGLITAPTMFCWGIDDPFLAPAQARPSIAKIPGAVLHEVPGGHGPWLENPASCARLTTAHLAATGFAPAAEPM